MVPAQSNTRIRDLAQSRALVIGASGVLGSRVTRQLLAAGALVRVLSPKDERPAEPGVESASGSLLDRDSLVPALEGIDVVFHLASRIPAGMAMRTARGWQANDRVRDLGTANLVSALLENPVEAVVMAGIAGSGQYSDAHWKSALEHSHALARSSLLAESHLEKLNGVMVWSCLRFGRFAGATIESGKQMIDAARRGINPFIGKPEDPVSLIHIDDAAEAVLAAARCRIQGGLAISACTTMPRGELALSLGKELRGRALWSLPTWLARLMLGIAYEPLCQPLRLDSIRFATATGWQPLIREPLEALLT